MSLDLHRRIDANALVRALVQVLTCGKAFKVVHIVRVSTVFRDRATGSLLERAKSSRELKAL
jgi:K+-transporting ATPase c subunit